MFTKAINFYSLQILLILHNAKNRAVFLKADKWLPKEFFVLGLDFTKSFSDKFHHAKEEYSMFIELAKIKKGEIDDQITGLRNQHERARNFSVEIARSIDGYEKGDDFHTGNIYEYLGYYNHLLGLHIHWEDHVFPHGERGAGRIRTGAARKAVQRR